MKWTALVCALAACHSDRGRALDLTLADACGANRFDVRIITVPPSSAPGGNTVTLTGHELVALLPEGTSHADVTVTAYADAVAVATSGASIDLPGPGEVAQTIAFAACDDLAVPLDLAMPDLFTFDLTSITPPMPDLSQPDLAGVDLNGAHLVTGVSVGGSFGASLYEAEGSATPAAGGPALLAVGVGLDLVTTITATAGATVGTPVHSADGTQLAAALQLPVDGAHGAAAPPQKVTLTFGTGASAPTASFTYVPLDEQNGAGSIPTSGSPVMLSTVSASGSTITLSGPSGPAFLLVTGAFAAAAVNAATTAGGFPGCSGACGAGNGPGVGMSGNGGGGAGYSMMGGGNGGPAYGDPSVIGLPGGSGGGPGSVAGGNGGATVRILAGSLAVNGAVSADGDSGQSAAGLALGQSGGGGGSGGTLLLQSRSSLSVGNAHAQGGGGGGGAVAGASGFNGADGRVRVDVAAPQAIPTATPVVGYVGATISDDFPTAQKSTGLNSIEVVCGMSTQVQLFVDGTMRGAITCDATTGRKSIPLSTPLVPDGSIHFVCVRSLAVAGTPTPRYASPLAEDTSCRSLVVVN